MSRKKVVIKPKPDRTDVGTTAQLQDDWVSKGREGEPPNQDDATKEEMPMKRLTIDIPEPLHARVKSECAKRRVKMADVVREFLENTFPEEGE